MSTEFLSPHSSGKTKKYLKLAIKAFLGIVVAMVLFAVTLYILVDPNDYKKEIAALVESSTGHKIKINGNIALSVFPWIGVEVNDVELENPPGFQGKMLAHVARIDIKARLFPLLASRLEMSTVTVRGLHLNLQVNKQGRENWQAAGAGSKTEKPKAGKSGKVNLNISGIAITEANVHYVNKQTGAEYFISDLNFETGNIGSGQANDVSITLNVKTSKRGKPLKAGFKGLLSFDSKADTLSLKKVTLTLGKAKLYGELAGSSVQTQPEFKGRFKSGTIDLRALLAQLGTPIHAMRSKHSLRKFSFNSTLSYKNNLLSLGNLNIKLDNSSLTGSLGLRLGSEVPAFSFRLTLDRLNLDDYLSPVFHTGKRKQPKHGPAAGSAYIPVRLIRKLQGDGSLIIQKLRALELDSQQVKIRLVARRGKLELISSVDNFYGGQYKGHTVVDARGAVPGLHIRESISGIKGPALYKILKPYLNYGGYLTNITGTASASANFRASGKTALALKRSLSGTASLNVRNGKLQGINAIKILCNYYNQFRRRPEINNNIKDTGFEKIKGTFTLNRGKFSNNDFIMLSSRGLLRLSGKGGGDLVRDRINYRLRTELVYSACDANEAQLTASFKERKAEFFVDLTGRLSSPTPRPDIKAAARSVLKNRLLRKLDKKGKKNNRLRELLRGL